MKRYLSIILLIGTLFFSGQALAYTVQATPVFDSGLGVYSVSVVANGEPNPLYGYNFDLYYNSALFTPVPKIILDPLNPFFLVETDFGLFANYMNKASFDTGSSVAVTVFDDGTNPLNPLVGGDPITLATLTFSGAANADTSGFVLDKNATLAPVPEPGTFILLGLGLAGLVGYRRKCRKA